jgi:hypothetical protein
LHVGGEDGKSFLLIDEELGIIFSFYGFNVRIFGVTCLKIPGRKVKSQIKRRTGLRPDLKRALL